MIELDDDKRAEIMDEIVEYTRRPELKPDEFTVRHFAEHKNISISKANGILVSLYHDGKLSRRRVWDEESRGEIWAYTKALPLDENEEDST